MVRRSKWSGPMMVGLLLSLGLTSCSLASGTPTPTPVPARTPTEGTVSAEAVVVPHRETHLSFKIPGRVAKVLVAEGQAVSAGQELARLDTSDLELAVRQSEAGLQSAQAQRAKLQAGARPEEIASAQAAAAKAQAGVKAAEAAVEISRGNLAAARATLSSAQASLDKLLAGPTPLDIQIAEKQVEKAKNDLWQAQTLRDSAGHILQGQVAAAETTVGIAELQLQQLKAGPRAEDVAVARAQVALATAGVRTAEGQLSQAQAQVDSATAQATQAQTGVDLLTAGSRTEDIAVAEAAVAQAEVAVAEAKDAMDGAVLKAPFDGTVGAILVNEGELASPQSPAVRLGDLTRLQVQTEDLSEVDVNQVREGQKARVTVDALGGRTFEGQVVRIVPMAVERRGDKVYTVILDLDVGQESGLRWGMSAFTEIQVQ